MKMVRVLVFFVAAIFSISSIGIFVVASMYYYSEGTSKENSIYGTAHEMETKNKIVSLPDTHDEAKTTTHMQVKSILQFAIVGFPKCSTTFLRNTLLAPNPQIFLGNKENEIHFLTHNNIHDFKALFKDQPDTINGFKCPDLLYSSVGLHNLEQHFQNTDLIIAVRHPILWFQSFYNYRVRKGHRMPDPYQLIGTCPTSFEGSLIGVDNKVSTDAHKVCTDRAQFHIAMSRLGKTAMNTPQELQLLRNHSLSIFNFTNKIFLMEIGQLSVENQTSANQFVNDLEIFLNLQGVVANKNPDVDDEEYSLPKLKHHEPRHYIDPEFGEEKVESRLIDICDARFEELREILLQTSHAASLWIRRYFINSPTVIVSQREQFEFLLNKWTIDPCLD